MAMTKAERAEMERLASDLRLAKALSWLTERPILMDADEALPKHTFSAEVIPAWWFNLHSASVAQGCFGHSSHSKWRTDKTDAQGRGGPWFQTKRDALLALRHAATADFAKRLAAIDAQIEAEEA